MLLANILFQKMIDRLGGFLQHNLVVFVAVVVLLAKWVLARLSNDEEAQSTAILSLPEDVCYVVLGLIMGDLIDNGAAFRRHFGRTDHLSMDFVVAIALILFAGIAIHKLAQKCSVQHKFWRAADRAGAADKDIDPDQAELGLQNGQNNLRILLMRHFLLFSVGYCVQWVIALILLTWVARVLTNN